MRIDNLPEQDTLWFEDENGNKLDVDTGMGMPDFKDKQWYMISNNAVVKDSINIKSRSDKLPVRFLKWLIKKMPNRWVGYSGTLCSGERSINCLYPIVKHLVENRKWSFNDAIVASSKLCERCMNIALDECEGKSFGNYDSNTICEYCQYIDPDYVEGRRIMACYKSFKNGENTKETYNYFHRYTRKPNCAKV